jgi:hypothetical protein
MEEEILDWQKEAISIINDVKNHVNNIEVSNSLVSDGSNIFMNLTTKEDKKFTLLLDKNGFKIVSNESYDSIDDESDEVFETIYALLQKNSEGYIKSFGNSLIDKLEKIQQ